MKFFKKKKELSSKSQHISIMYLSRAKTQLERELESNERTGSTERFTAEYDIKCLDEAIGYLGGVDDGSWRA